MTNVLGVSTLWSGDDRTMQTRSRLRKKLGQRRAACDNNSNANSSSATQNSTKISSTTTQKSTANSLYCSQIILCFIIMFVCALLGMAFLEMTYY